MLRYFYFQRFFDISIPSNLKLQIQGRRDWDKVDRVRCLKPVYRFDHIVIERYPSFNDALRDMDDALCMIFMFARLPKSSTVHAEMIENCRRISMEWMNYCIHSQSLRDADFDVIES